MITYLLLNYFHCRFFWQVGAWWDQSAWTVCGWMIPPQTGSWCQEVRAWGTGVGSPLFFATARCQPGRTGGDYRSHKQSHLEHHDRLCCFTVSPWPCLRLAAKQRTAPPRWHPMPQNRGRPQSFTVQVRGGRNAQALQEGHPPTLPGGFEKSDLID